MRDKDIKDLRPWIIVAFLFVIVAGLLARSAEGQGSSGFQYIGKAGHCDVYRLFRWGTNVYVVQGPTSTSISCSVGVEH